MTIFDNFWIFEVFFIDFLDFFGFFGFLDILNFFVIFCIFFGFFWFFFGSFKVTNVTTKCYHGYYWTLKIAKNGPKQHKKALAEGQSPPQELEVGPRSGPYLLVVYEWYYRGQIEC